MSIDDQSYKDREAFKAKLKREEREAQEESKNKELAERRSSDLAVEKEISEREYNLAKYGHELSKENRDLDFRDERRFSEVRVTEQGELARINRETTRQEHHIKMSEMRQDLKHKLIEKIADYTLGKKAARSSTDQQIRFEEAKATLAAKYGEESVLDILKTLDDFEDAALQNGEPSSFSEQESDLHQTPNPEKAKRH